MGRAPAGQDRTPKSAPLTPSHPNASTGINCDLVRHKPKKSPQLIFLATLHSILLWLGSYVDIVTVCNSKAQGSVCWDYQFELTGGMPKTAFN